MADIGYMGEIPFTTSADKIRTFSDFSRKGDPRLGSHDIIGGKSRLEFIAAANEEISMSIKLSTGIGLDPEKELEDLREMRDTGAVFNLFIGGKPVSENKWIISSMGEDVKYFNDKGEIISVDVSLTLKEYVEDIEQVKDENQEGQQTPMSGSSEYMGGDILGGGEAFDHTAAH